MLHSASKVFAGLLSFARFVDSNLLGWTLGNPSWLLLWSHASACMTMLAVVLSRLAAARCPAFCQILRASLRLHGILIAYGVRVRGFGAGQEAKTRSWVPALPRDVGSQKLSCFTAEAAAGDWKGDRRLQSCCATLIATDSSGVLIST